MSPPRRFTAAVSSQENHHPTDAEQIEELRRFVRGKGFDEQPMPGHGSQALDLREASESFAPIRKLARRDLETLRLVTAHQVREVLTVGGMILFGKVCGREFPAESASA